MFLSDGIHVNHTLVKDGWCRWYRKYAPRNRDVERLEKHAREDKKGLWADPQPVPPWEWRKRTPLRPPPCPANTYGQYFDLDFPAGFCLLGFRGTTSLDTMTSLEGFLTRRFCFRFTVGFVLPPAGTFFFGVRFLTVRFVALDCAFFRDFIVPFIPAWAIDRAFWRLSRRFFIAMPLSCQSRKAFR